jgi:hypothetical protein
MALGAFSGIDVAPGSDLIALSLWRTAITVVAAATARTREQGECAGGDQELEPALASSRMGA